MNKFRRKIQNGTKALLKLGNWTEPAVDAYLRMDSLYRTARVNRHGKKQTASQPLQEIIWPDNPGPGQAAAWLRAAAKSMGQRYKLTYQNIPQIYNDILIFHILDDHRLIKAAIDVTDYTSRVEPECLATVDIYFKLQFNENGYNNNKVVPGGFVPRGEKIYYYLPTLRAWSLDQTRKTYDTYGRFGAQFGFEVRSKAIDILKSQTGFEFYGDMDRVLYARYLREASRSRICIDLPGNGPFCFRLIEYLALGCCVIAYPHRTRFNHHLTNGQNIVYCKEDMSDLVELCEQYLDDDDERTRIGTNAAAFFDEYLHIDKLTEYWISTTIESRSRP